MKRFLSILSALTVLASIVIPFSSVSADTNLIANPSAETAAASGQPANWTANRWGNNSATLNYANDGHTGSHSLAVSMTARTDGDAKWMADPVNVAANKSYTYTSWYKASVPTEIDLQYLDASDNASYAYVQTVPASSDWQQLSTTFTTPANASKVTVMHLLASAGSLQTDDFTLNETVALPPPAQPPVGTNLITNPSFETANGASPAAWEKNQWGSHTATFTYPSTGHTGSRSAQVSITSFTSGDAKWVATPVNVTPGQLYRYSDWYKSGVSTRVVVAFINSAGVYSYTELSGAAASTAWRQYSTTFSVPSGTAKATVFHLLDKVGTLTVDDVSLAKEVPSAELVPNGSVEQISPASNTQPDRWTSSSWGTNTPTFQYVNGGHTGAKSVKVTVKNYVDGDAKWFFNPITNLEKGKQYRLTAWYKTNTQPKAVAMFNMADGSTKYFGMPAPFPAATSTLIWQKYSETFTVPEDAVSVSAFMFIDKNGWLQTDDYSLTPYSPTGWNRPLLTMTFDDGHEDNATNALPLLNQYGLKTTQCFATEHIEGQEAQVVDNVLAFYRSGHEVCSHTVSHPFLTQVTKTQLTYELQHSKQYLESIIGAPVRNFASPYGDYSKTVNNEIKKYYGSHRTVDEGFNSKDNFDPHRLRVQNIFSTTSAAQVQAWIQRAQADKTWLILVYHRVANDPGQYDSYIDVFGQHLQAIQQSGITVKTYQAALDELKTQR